MSYKAGNYIFDKVTLPDTLNGSNSRSFSVADGAKVMTIHAPSLTGSASLKLQALDPQDGDQSAETWRDLWAVVIVNTAVGFGQMIAIPSNQATTVPVAALGGTVLRFVTSAAQNGGGIDYEQIIVSWGKDG